jgi:hypothetical protein
MRRKRPVVVAIRHDKEESNPTCMRKIGSNLLAGASPHPNSSCGGDTTLRMEEPSRHRKGLCRKEDRRSHMYEEDRHIPHLEWKIGTSDP